MACSVTVSVGSDAPLLTLVVLVAVSTPPETLTVQPVPLVATTAESGGTVSVIVVVPDAVEPDAFDTESV